MIESITTQNILLLGSILLFASILLGKTGHRFGVPALLLFLIIGMVAGTDGLGIEYDDMRGAQFIGMVSLCIILFSGGMDTKFESIRPVLLPGLVLSTAGVLLTAAFSGLFIWWITGMSWSSIHLGLMTSLLLAATMSSTDSASVFAILRSQKMKLKYNLRPMLELESGSNDPMAYMLTVVIIQLITGENAGLFDIMFTFFRQFGFGLLAGYGLGKLAVYAINNLDMDNKALYPIFTLAFTFFAFSVTDMLGGNGYLAVYIGGMLIGNSRIANRREIGRFFDGLTWLFQIIMFIMLGLLVNPHELLEIAPIGLLIGLFMILAARPASVFLCLAPFRKIKLRSRFYVSWVGLRGAVPIIFAIYPVIAHIPQARQLFNIVFFITIMSLVLQGMTIPWMARRLQLSSELESEESDFGVEIPEEMGSQLTDLTVTERLLEEGDTLKDISLPHDALVMIVRRGEEYLIPDGSLQLHVGDELLLISEKKE